jgi:hypothetical protein
MPLRPDIPHERSGRDLDQPKKLELCDAVGKLFLLEDGDDRRDAVDS